MTRLLVLLGLAACTACPPVAERPLVAACIVREDLPEPVDGVRRLKLTGRARSEFGRSESCAEGWQLGSRDATDTEFATWAELNGADGRFVVGIWADGYERVEAGERRLFWDLDVRIEEGGASFIDIRDEAGRQVFWIGQAPDTTVLQHPPDLIVDEGRPVCRGERSCGEVRGRTLEVEVEQTRRELRPHERLEATTGFTWDPIEHVVVHGGYDAPTKAGGCASDAQLTVAWWER